MATHATATKLSEGRLHGTPKRSKTGCNDLLIIETRGLRASRRAGAPLSARKRGGPVGLEVNPPSLPTGPLRPPYPGSAHHGDESTPSALSHKMRCTGACRAGFTKRTFSGGSSPACSMSQQYVSDHRLLHAERLVASSISSDCQALRWLRTATEAAGETRRPAVSVSER
jgi:hypothetical protein